MTYLRYEVDLESGDTIEVTLEKQANVLVMDDENLRAYLQGRRYHYHGGHVRFSPIQITPPTAGRWNVVIDLGGYPGTVRAGVGVLRAATIAS